MTISWPVQWYGIWEFKLNHWNASLANPSETSPRVKRCASNSIPALAENLYDLLEIFFYSHGYGLVWDNVVCKSLTRIFQKKLDYGRIMDSKFDIPRIGKSPTCGPIFLRLRYTAQAGPSLRCSPWAEWWAETWRKGGVPVATWELFAWHFLNVWNYYWLGIVENDEPTWFDGGLVWLSVLPTLGPEVFDDECYYLVYWDLLGTIGTHNSRYLVTDPE